MGEGGLCLELVKMMKKGSMMQLRSQPGGGFGKVLLVWVMQRGSVGGLDE